MELRAAAKAAFERVAAASAGRLLEPFEAYSHYMELGGSHWFTASPHAKPEPATTNVANKGDNNFVFVGFGGALPRVVRFRGPGNVIFLGPHSAASGALFDVQGADSLTYVGAFTTMETAASVFARPPASVIIGDHCYIGERVQASGSDHHGIYSLASRQRINNNRDILIGDRVFVGANTRINKGVVMEPGGIVLGGSIVTGTIRSNCAYHGVPARLIHEDVAWGSDAERFDDLDAALASAEESVAVRIDALKTRIATFTSRGAA